MSIRVLVRKASQLSEISSGDRRDNFVVTFGEGQLVDYLREKNDDWILKFGEERGVDLIAIECDCDVQFQKK